MSVKSSHPKNEIFQAKLWLSFNLLCQTKCPKMGENELLMYPGWEKNFQNGTLLKSRMDFLEIRFPFLLLRETPETSDPSRRVESLARWHAHRKWTKRLEERRWNGHPDLGKTLGWNLPSILSLNSAKAEKGFKKVYCVANKVKTLLQSTQITDLSWNIQLLYFTLESTKHLKNSVI